MVAKLRFFTFYCCDNLILQEPYRLYSVQQA